jgi:hypothetical protein
MRWSSSAAGWWWGSTCWSGCWAGLQRVRITGIWHRHTWMLARERDRLSLICHECGDETPGIDVSSTRIRFYWMLDKHRRRFNLRRSA